MGRKNIYIKSASYSSVFENISAAGGSADSRLCGSDSIAGRSRDFVGRHRGPASGLGGIGVPALGHMIILRFGT